MAPDKYESYNGLVFWTLFRRYIQARMLTVHVTNVNRRLRSAQDTAELTSALSRTLQS